MAGETRQVSSRPSWVCGFYLLSKTDLCDEQDITALEQRLRSMQWQERRLSELYGDCPVDEVLNITGFNMNDVLDVDPAFFK